MCTVLVACEESQAVTKELRKLGLQAFSCDTKECSGGHPEWHIKDDVRRVIKIKWDMIIAFPPCTHLSISGAKWFEDKSEDGRQNDAIDFFELFTKTDCKKVAIENPIGIMSSLYRPPDQIIQPYYFGDSFQKSTCFWLKGLPKLRPTKIVSPGEFVIHGNKKFPKWYSNAPMEDRGSFRSKTFPGIAEAMAKQWGLFLKKTKEGGVSMAKRLGDMRKSAGGKSKRKSTRKNKEPPKKVIKSDSTIHEQYKKASSNKPPDKIKFYSIKEKMPPDKPITILYFDSLFGYDIGISSIILQHIHQDIRSLGFSRTTHWASLKTKKE